MSVEVYDVIGYVCIIGFFLFMIIGIVSLVLKKGKESLKWFGIMFAFALVFIGFLIFFYIQYEVNGSTSYKVNQPDDTTKEIVELTEDSFEITQKAFEYNRDDNELIFEFDTNLPNGTKVNALTNLWQPDDWEENLGVRNYTYLFDGMEKEAFVSNGKIEYKLDNQSLNGRLVPESKVSIRFFLPVTDKDNIYLKEQFPTRKDFEEEFPRLWANGKGDGSKDYEIISDWYNPELKNGHSPEEIYAYYNKETISYKELEKNPSKYNGTPISFTGKILQIQTEEVENPSKMMLKQQSTIRLAIDDNYDNEVYVTVVDYNGMEGIVSEDVITVYGEMTGSVTYESVAGYQITLPSMKALIYKKK